MCMKSKPHDGEHVWLRWDGEHEKAYEAYAMYRDSAPRPPMQVISDHIGSPVATVYRWSSWYAWKARTEAFDRHRDKAVIDHVTHVASTVAGSAVRRDLQEKELSRTRRAQAARLMVDVGMSELERLAERIAKIRAEEKEKGEQAKELVAPRDIARLVTEGAKLEALVVGDATEITGEEQRWDLSKLSPEELDQLERLLAKVPGAKNVT